MGDTLYRCTLCDKKVEASGRYGHVKFKDGNGHGPQGEVPDDPDDYFVEYDAEAEERMGNDSGEENPESDKQSTAPESEENDPVEVPGSGDSGNRETAGATGETGSVIERFKTWLTTPISEQ